MRPRDNLSLPDSGRQSPQDGIRSLARELERLSISDPRVALGRARAWVAEAAESTERAWAQRALALALRVNGRYDEAEAHFAGAAQSFGDLGLVDELARTRTSLVETLRFMGRFDEAVVVAEENLAYLRSRGPAFALDAAKQTVNLGLLHWRRGRLEDALDTFEQARRIGIRLGVEELAATSTMNMGLVLADLGRFSEALRAGRYAAVRFRRLGVEERLATVLMNIGLLYMRRGEYAQALNELGESRAICEKLGLQQKSAEVDLDVARTYLQLNLNQEAGEACGRAVETLRQLNLPFELAHALLRSGQVAGLRQELTTASQLFGEAHDVFARIGNDIWSSLAAAHLAQLDRARPARDRAQELLAYADRLEQLGALDHAANALLWASDLFVEVGNGERALLTVGAAVALGERLGADEVLRRAHTARGLILQQLAPEQAREAYVCAIRYVERLRAGARADDLKMSVVADRVDLYERVASILLSHPTPDHEREAFEWIERGKSRGLVDDALSSASAAPTSMTPRARRARSRIADLRGQLDAAYSRRYTTDGLARAATKTDESHIEGIESLLATAMRELQMLVRADRAADGTGLLTLQRVQEHIPETTVLLAYALLDQELVCFSVGRNTFAAHRGLATSRQLDEAFEWFWFHIRKGGYGADYLRSNYRTLMVSLGDVLQRLSQLLLAPTAREIRQSEHVVIVPHRALHTLPFHALPFDDASLLDHARVSYSPSGAVFAMTEGQPQPQIGHPLVMAPDVEGLPWISHEAHRVASLFPGAIELTGRKATMAAMRRHAPDCDAIHLATHGVFRADNPRFSALQLADGWLTVGDLAELSSGRSLVTLSACHTGMSGVGPGDELVGLTRAVLGAGSAALVASLWAANDETTSTLMTSFYAGLRNGLSRSAALRLAALRVRDADPHPYFWAPFVLVGAA